MTNDSGQLSLDFIIGFTIFLLAFIFVATLMSGLIIGLQSKTIDLDAVAYRTGVIIVEDPGQPSIPISQVEIDPLNQWEMIEPDKLENIIRFGLALSKETPNIISRAKVEKFFNTTIFSYPEDYRKRLIFSGEGTYPYYFNITLNETSHSTLTIHNIGERIPQNYGYIKRTVFIKESSNVSYNLPLGHGNISVVFDLPTLYDNTRGPVYWIDPLTENITVTLNTSGRSLYNCFISKSTGSLFVDIPGRDFLPVSVEGNLKDSYPISVNSGPIEQNFPAGYFANLGITKADQIMITYIFDDANDDLTYGYNYTTASQSPLAPAILEVRIW